MFEQMVFAHLQFTRAAVSSDQRGCTSAVGEGFGVYHEKTMEPTKQQQGGPVESLC